MKNDEKISNEAGNWYMVEIIEKCEPVSRNEEQDLRRVVTYGNHHLIKADSPEQAYDKAVTIGREHEYRFFNTNKIEMEWSFVGIRNLLPIYEDIEDGAELMCSDYGFISNRNAMKMAFAKNELVNAVKPKNS